MNVGDVIRTIQLRFTTEGEQKATAALKGVQSAHEAVAKSSAHTAQVTDTSAKHQLSLAQSMERLERRFNQTARAQFEYAKVQDQVNKAVAQNPALQARANDVLARAAAHFNSASVAQTRYAQGMQFASEQATMFAARGGAASTALMGFGPAGIAAGAALGAAAIGGSKLVGMVTDLSERSGKLVDFAESTGLTTTALQGLNQAGAEVGINQEKVGNIVERFTTQLADLRKGEGDLFKQLTATNPALVDQLASTRDVAKAWDIMSRAVAGATDQIERNRLVTAVAGRRNIGAGRLFSATEQAGGIGGLTGRAGLIISDEALRRWDELGDRITIASQQAKSALASIFADEVLNAQLKFAETMLAIGKIGMDFKLSDDFKLLQKLFMLSPPAWIDRLLGGAAAQIRDFAASPVPSTKVGQDERGTGVESNQANLALSRQYLAVQNELTNQFNLQMQAIGARTQEERIALAVEQRRVELSKTNISDAQLATELERTRTLAVARTAASHRDAMTAMSGQLAIAQAVTAQERMAAQQLVTYNQLKDQGRTHEQASLEALRQRQIAQAQINSQAQGTLAGLEDQHRVITATTEAEKLRAQEAARYNELIRQGVESGQAASIAAQERLNAEAAITAQAEKQAAAYRKCIYEVSQLSIELEQAASSAKSFLGSSDNWLRGGAGGGGYQDPYRPGRRMDFEFNTLPSGQGFASPWGEGGAQEVPGQLQMGRLSQGYRPYVFGGGYIPNEQGFEFQVDEILKKTGSLDAAIAHLNKYISEAKPWDPFANPQAATSVLRELFDLKGDMTGDTTQQQQFLEQQIRMLESQPKTLENFRLLRELKDSLDNLRESTDALNTTIGLDPLYTQGHGYVGIGYNPHGGSSPRIPIDPNTQPYVPSLAQPTVPTGTGGPMPTPTNRLGFGMTSPSGVMIDPRTGRPIMGLANGGSFMVGGSGGVDSKYVPLRLTPGELIEVTPEREVHTGTFDRNAKPTVVNNNVTNTFNFPPSRSGYGDRRSQRHLTENFGRAIAQAR